MAVEPFFIVGSGRSGTTLLRAVLNVSPDVHVPLESDFLARAYRFYKKKRSYDLRDYVVLSEFFSATSQMAGWGLAKADVVDALRVAEPKTFAQVNDAIYRFFLRQEGFHSAQWGIKSPVLIAGIREVRDTFPDAKIIHMLRDGRDVYLSYERVHSTNEKSFGPKTIWQAALYWVDGLRRIDHLRGDEQLLEVRYEDLLADPDSTIADVCDFLGIRYCDGMASSYFQSERNRNLLVPDEQESIHQKVMQGVDASNAYKYRSQMSRGSRLVFEVLASHYLRRYGYKCEFHITKWRLWEAVRLPCFVAARLFNNARYARRDYRYWRRAQKVNMLT